MHVCFGLRSCLMVLPGKLEQMMGLELATSAWELKFSFLYFQNLQNCSGKSTCMQQMSCTRRLICV